VDLGPLTDLIGVWQGDVGVDIAPEPDGTETNNYFETITYSRVGDVTNAESQNLAAVHYRQVVQRISTGKVIHDQTGYWMWVPQSGIVMHSLLIPRGVGVLAGGTYSGEKDPDGRTVITVIAKLDDPDWKIIQAPFMDKNASTDSFAQQLIVGNGKLTYSQTTMLTIYDKVFEHTDQNELTLT
jgi:hypothetical protein